MRTHGVSYRRSRPAVNGRLRIASNQMLLNFSPTRSPGRSSHEIGDSWSGLVGKTRRKASVELICRALRRRLLLIDTRLGSRNCHYVNPTFRQHFI